MMSLAPVFASLGRAGKKKTLKIHKKSRFQPNEKNFAKSCSVRYLTIILRERTGYEMIYNQRGATRLVGYDHFISSKPE